MTCPGDARTLFGRRYSGQATRRSAGRDAAQKESSRKEVTLNIYFFRGFIFLFPARFAAARPLVVYGYFFFPTLGISNSPHKWTSDKIVVYSSRNALGACASVITGGVRRSRGLFLLALPHRYNFPITVEHKRQSKEPYVLKANRVCGIPACINWLMEAGDKVEPAKDDRVVGLKPHIHAIT